MVTGTDVRTPRCGIDVRGVFMFGFSGDRDGRLGTPRCMIDDRRVSMFGFCVDREGRLYATVRARRQTCFNVWFLWWQGRTAVRHSSGWTSRMFQCLVSMMTGTDGCTPQCGLDVTRGRWRIRDSRLAIGATWTYHGTRKSVRFQPLRSCLCYTNEKKMQIV